MPSPLSILPSERPRHRFSRAPRKGPLLASEVLRDDAAPLEPGRRSIRVWLSLIAIALFAMGWLFSRGAGVPGMEAESAALSLAAASTLLAIAVLPFPYGVRAGLALSIALTTMLLGLRGTGPLAGLAVDGGLFRDALRLLAVTALSSALFFRSTYSEYGRSRVLLLVAFALSLPFLGAEVALVVSTDAGIAARAWAALNTLLVLASLLGLMSAAAGVGSNAMAALLLLLVPGEIALRAWSPLAGPGTGLFTYPLTATAFSVVTLLASLSLFQVLSWALAPEARRLSQVRPTRA
jgi:hypothetical protein